MRNTTNKPITKKYKDLEITSLPSIDFEDKVMEDIQKIVLKRKIKRDRIKSMVFASLACLAILLFCIVFNEIGMDILPSTAKRFYLLIQGVMASAIIFLIQILIETNIEIRQLSRKTL